MGSDCIKQPLTVVDYTVSYREIEFRVFLQTRRGPQSEHGRQQ